MSLSALDIEVFEDKYSDVLSEFSGLTREDRQELSKREFNELIESFVDSKEKKEKNGFINTKTK